LLLAALACGSDPFDDLDTEEGRNVLELFGKDHPAIEYLRGLEFPWPEFNPTRDDAGYGEWDSVEETPLVKLGYHAGRTHGAACGSSAINVRAVADLWRWECDG
jgi:hypothetical protein